MQRAYDRLTIQTNLIPGCGLEAGETWDLCSQNTTVTGAPSEAPLDLRD